MNMTSSGLQCEVVTHEYRVTDKGLNLGEINYVIIDELVRVLCAVLFLMAASA